MANKIFVLILICYASVLAQECMVPLKVNGRDITIGIHPFGSDSFDVGLDVLAPPLPPPPTFDARLKWKGDEYLTDIRSNALKPDTFRLAYRRAEESDSIIIKWDKNRLQALADTIYMTDDFGLNLFHLDMKRKDSLDVSVSPLLRDQLRIVFKARPDKPVSVDEYQSSENFPNHFNLSQNYPNPFNPETSISYALPKPAHVVLKVYDILGRQARTLVNEMKPAGRHRVTWNGRDAQGLALPSGIYLYKIQAGEFEAVRKMLLAK